jgi:DNA-binding transcriptional regulator YiaG
VTSATRYVAERRDGAWQVRDTTEDRAVEVCGAGSRGAAEARAGAYRLNKPVRQSWTPEQIREWRTRRKLSQAGLARLLGVQPLAVTRWELGTRAVPSYLHLALKYLETVA